MDWKQRAILLIILFLLLAAGSLYFIRNIRFSYDFEQFFPKGDPDLQYFLLHRAKFEPDDNFLLVGIYNKKGVFDNELLKKIDTLTKACKDLPGVRQVHSLTNFQYAVNTPLGLMSYPAVNIDKPENYPQDSIRIMKDERLTGRLISRDAKTIVVTLKTKDVLSQSESERLVNQLEETINQCGIQDYHLLGKAYFQKVYVHMLIREFIFSTSVAAILVTLVFTLFYRRFWGVAIALCSVFLAMILFMGFLGARGVPLDVISAIYPILMIIVGVSDVVHIMTKYIIELRKGTPPHIAIKITRREIGIATFLTSLTTAIGFATLLTSKVPPVSRFGITAAIGVMIAYTTVILFTPTALSLFKADKISFYKKDKGRWHSFLESFYHFTKRSPKQILAGLGIFLIFTAIGISRISTDIHIHKTLPRGKKITEDFKFFEREFSGFRPFEIAATAKEDYYINDPEVLREIDKVEQFVNKYPEVNGTISMTTLYKTLHRTNNGDRLEAYIIPEEDEVIERYNKIIKKLPKDQVKILMSGNRKVGRISAFILDIGTDSIQQIISDVDAFIADNIDTSKVTFRQTGTGVIIDKNNKYLRSSIIGGLSIAFAAVSIIMALLFQNLKMVIISLIPNLLPLLFGGAMVGYAGIELDAPTAIIFAIAFGIAVDDTIHFLSKYKLEIQKGRTMEEALYATTTETGKAIIVTSIILFFGFLILLFSSNPATFNVGFMISISLFSAVFADLLIIPLLIRLWMKPSN